MAWLAEGRAARVALLAAALTVAALAAAPAIFGLFSPAGSVAEHRVASEALTFRIKASGELVSASSVGIGPPIVPRVWNFTVTDLAPEGKPVAAGQPVVGFDVKELRQRLELSRSQLAEAEKELEKVTLEEQEALDGLLLQRADLDTTLAKTAQKLQVPGELVARVELEKLRLDERLARTELRLMDEQIAVQRFNLDAAVKSARNRVDRLRGDVEELVGAIRAMSVRAPRDGFLVYVPDWEGKKVAAGDNVWFGQSLLEIADLSQMQVAAVIPEPDAALVRVGQPVEIRLAANPDRLFTGKIESLGRVFRMKSYDKPSTVFDAVVSIDVPDEEIMRPGMAAEVVVLASSPEALACVPERAVRFVDGRPVVTVVRDGAGPREVAVRLGRRAPPQIEVLEGLEEGDVVIVPQTAAEPSS